MQQIAYILKQANDGLSVEEVCRKAGVTCFPKTGPFKAGIFQL